MTMFGDRGKWAEAQVQKWLEKRSASELAFAYHRYPDARAARGALANQPADFLVARKTKLDKVACHLEVKETKEVRRLPKAKIGQYGKLKLFHEAGFDTVVLVFRSELKDWVMFTPEDLFCYEELPTSFPFAGLAPYQSAASALDALFPN